MRKSSLCLERLREGLSFAERVIGRLEEKQTERHIRNAMKECLLASQSVIDSVIDTLEEEEPSSPSARKITISSE
jgi:hypothetical protein